MNKDYEVLPVIHANLVRDVMDEKYFAVSKENLVKDVITGFRNYIPESEETRIYYIYVTDSKGRLSGVISLGDLLNAKGDQEVSKIMKEDVASLKGNEDVEIAARKMAKMRYRALPVVGRSSKLLGVVRSEEMLNVIEEEATEDIFKSAGMVFADEELSRSQVILKSSPSKILKIRIPWLLIALAGGLLAGFVIEGFEETLGAVIALAFFLPVVMDTGGNVGTQSSTIFVRGLALGQIDEKNIFKSFATEGKIGILIGLALGVPGGLFAYIWQGIFELGIVVFLTLLTVSFVASTIGYAIPWISVKLGYDPAAVSDPVITTIKDITGLVIYFGLAAIFLL